MKRFRKIALRLTAVVATLGFLGFAGIGWFGSERITSPPRRSLQDYHLEILGDARRFGLSVTSFTSAGGTPALMVRPADRPGEARKSKQLRRSLPDQGVEAPPWGRMHGTVVLLHGHCGRKVDFLPVCERICAAGFRCLIPDLPGHGEHPSGLATFGWNECRLIEEILDDAEVTFGFANQPAHLFGVSQGGAIALQTAARNPSRWSSVVSAAAFASLDQPILRSAESLHHLLRPLAPLNALAVESATWCRSGMWPNRIRPLDEARRLTMPVMVIHGEDDRFIPIEQGHGIFGAIPARTKVFRPVADAGHGRVLAQDADRLYPEICAFLLRASGAPASTGR